jgi:hypothetical protein
MVHMVLRLALYVLLWVYEAALLACACYWRLASVYTYIYVSLSFGIRDLHIHSGCFVLWVLMGVVI